MRRERTLWMWIAIGTVAFFALAGEIVRLRAQPPSVQIDENFVGYVCVTSRNRIAACEDYQSSVRPYIINRARRGANVVK